MSNDPYHILNSWGIVEYISPQPHLRRIIIKNTYSFGEDEYFVGEYNPSNWRQSNINLKKVSQKDAHKIIVECVSSGWTLLDY